MKLNFIFILLLINFLCDSSFSSENNNQEIIISEDNPIKSQSPTEINNRKSHIVQKGESLLSISRMYSLDKNFLIKINQLKDENLILVGQTLKLIENETYNPNGQNKFIPQNHEILEGENLTEISNRYGLKINDLINLNNLDNPDNLEVGTILLLINPSENIQQKTPTISKEYNNELKVPPRYGPLIIESSELEVVGGRKTLNAINNNNKTKLILSIKCETKEIDVRKKGRRWKGWMPIKENFEERLINDFC